MATTTTPTRTRTTLSNGKKGESGAARAARPRVRGSARAESGDGTREPQYDLLTAALLGLAIGAGTTLLFRRGPSGLRPIGPAWRAARAGAKLAGRGARYAWERGGDAWERVPREEIQQRLRDYFESARDTIDSVVESELKDLRRAIRKRRKKLGF